MTYSVNGIEVTLPTISRIAITLSGATLNGPTDVYIAYRVYVQDELSEPQLTRYVHPRPIPGVVTASNASVSQLQKVAAQTFGEVSSADQSTVHIYKATVTPLEDFIGLSAINISPNSFGYTYDLKSTTIVCGTSGCSARTTSRSITTYDNLGASATYPIDTVKNDDVIAPVISIFYPSDNAVEVPVDTDIVLTYDEAIARGTGEIVIKLGSGTGTVVETFDVETSARLVFSDSTLTISPTNDLSHSSQYFVVIPSGVVMDLAGNSYSGTDTYDFTTASDSGLWPGLTFIELDVARLKKFDEGGAVVFDLVRSGDVSGSTSVSWVLSNEGWGRSATPTDFGNGAQTAFPSGLVVFSPGETRKMVSVDVFDDSKVEGEEWIGIQLLPSGQFWFGGAGNASAVLIADNDEAANNTRANASQRGIESLIIEESIDYDGDIDFYKFNLVAGQSYLFSTLSYQADGFDDFNNTEIFGLDVLVYDNFGSLINVFRQKDILTPSIESSQLVFQPNKSDVYYIAISAALDSDAKTGAYDFLATNIGTDDFAEGIQTHGRLLADSRQVLSAAIHSPDDIDSFWVYLDPTLGPQDLMLDTLGRLDLRVDVMKPNGSALTITKTQATDSIGSFSVYSLMPDIAGDHLVSVEKNNNSSSTGHYIVFIESPSSGPQMFPSVFSVSQQVGYLEEPVSGQSDYFFTLHREGLSNVPGSVRVDVKPLPSGENGWSSVDPSDFATGGLSYPSFVVTFEAGEAKKIIAIPIASDSKNEGDEYFVVSLSEPMHNGVVSTLRFGGVESFGRIVDQNVTNVNQVGGHAYHWKTGTLLSGVEINGAGVFSDAAGVYLLEGLGLGAHSVNGSKESLPSGQIGSVITSEDALAALRIALGRSPNADGSEATPYQFIAADIDRDGKVTSTDALQILKMSLGRADAPTPQWVFVDEMADFWDETLEEFSTSRWEVPRPEDLAISVDPAVRSEVNLVGILQGDINGSWTPPAASTLLPESYFTNLAVTNPNTINITQFG